MARKPQRALRVLLLLAASTPAVAQYVSSGSPPESNAASAASAENLQIVPNKGQSAQQQATDRYQCHTWATGQTGFDPSEPPTGMSPGETARRASDYRRAMTACLEGRGYTVRFIEAPAAPPGNAAAAAAGAPSPTEPSYLGSGYSSVATLTYRPLSVQLDAGYTAAAGSTSDSLNGGPNAGLGLTWFPTSELPIGLRVDGSYSWFGEKRQALASGPGFTSGHEEIYGGDADLQLDLAHRSSLAKLYLLGGVGWYQQRFDLRQVSFESAGGCSGFVFFCGPRYFPVVSGFEHTTSPWDLSWNAGGGWEIAAGPRASFFIEARYLRISANGRRLQFVPVRLGVRF